MTSTAPRDSQVRMGQNRRGRKHKVAAAITALTATLGTAAVVLIFSGGGDDDRDARRGCSTDAGCGSGRICAAGGCLLLIPDESPAIWHDELQAQTDPKKRWEPDQAFGLRLHPRSRCDVPRESVELPPFSQVTVKSEAMVYEALAEGLWLHFYQTAQARIWIDALSWPLPAVFDAPPSAICAGSGVRAVEVDSANGTRVAAALTQTVPVGGRASGEISVRLEMPGADSLGERTLILPLYAKSETEEKRTTALALPLGTEVAAMEGPVPSAQRLLDGFVAYYWDHKPQPSQAAVRFTLPEGKKTKRLDISSVRP